MADEKHMPTEMALRLEGHGVIPPRTWPKLDALEKTVRKRRGILSLETTRDGTTARVTLLGNRCEAVADEPAAAVCAALADALDAANPQLPLDGGETVDRGTGEISEDLRARARTLADMGVTITTASGGDDVVARAARDVAQAVNAAAADKAAMARTVKAAGGLDVRYDEGNDLFLNGEGDAFASGIVEDAHAQLARA